MNVNRLIPTSRKNKIIIISISLIILIAIILLSIAGANYAKCGEFKLKCPEKTPNEELDEMDEDLIKESEEEMEQLTEGKMCNFVNIKDVNPSPDKDADGNFDADESVPCETCGDYKLNGVKMTPFIDKTVVYTCVDSDEDDDDCLKKQETVLDDIGMCRASLLD